MVTVFLVLVATLAVLAAGEAVREQCRRMLSRPMLPGQLLPAGNTSSATSNSASAH